MKAICIPYTDNEELQNQWDYFIFNFEIDQVYMIGGAWISNSTKGAVIINDASQLPNDLQKVLISPKDARYHQGVESLVGFNHPLDKVVYVFGDNDKYMDDEYLGGASLDACVYIPMKEETYNFMAAAIVFYDRIAKNG